MIELCALEEEWRGFPLRDQTQLGGCGASVEDISAVNETLRIKLMLARALYAVGDLYLIDDDVAIDEAFLKKIINYLLKKQACVLRATDNFSSLKGADCVIFMRAGSI